MRVCLASVPVKWAEWAGVRGEGVVRVRVHPKQEGGGVRGHGLTLTLTLSRRGVGLGVTASVSEHD